MNELPTVQGSLTEAFRRFESAALGLEERHATLIAKTDRLERRLIDSNRRLEAVLDALDTGVAVVSASGALLRTNAAFERMMVHGDGRRLDDAALAHLIRSESGSGGSARLRRDGGDGIRDLAATLIPVGDEEGTRVLAVQDITEIRHQEEEGGRRQRLEALGRMAAELAHEVRNPLGSIRLFAAMLRDDLEARETQRTMVEQILAATSGLESIVTNLLAFASPSREERREVDLATLAREACALLGPACSVRGVELGGPATDESCVVHADPEGMRQVVLNLLSNALAATKDAGRIEIGARYTGQRALLSVVDDGSGIAAEDLTRVFDPFFTRSEGGSGLGLSIVHGIVERHQGRITLDSRPEEGTRVRVEIPLQGSNQRRRGTEETHE